MGYYAGRSESSSFFDAFTLNPLPYPVLLILAVICIFLGISSYFSYESIIEDTEEQIGWIVKVVPIFLLIAVRWLSSMENPEWLFGRSPYDGRWKTQQYRQSEGSSPWGVAVLIVVLLVMVSYQSTFLDSWFA